MCGTSTVGQSTQLPMTTATSNTTQVAGESGKGVAQGGGGTDIASALAEISKQIEALKQILAGNSAVQGTSGGGAASTAQSMNGANDAMAGCNMGGGPGGKDSSVDGEHGGHDTTQTGTQTDGSGGKDTAVDGETGNGTQTGEQTDGSGDKDVTQTDGGGGTDKVAAAQAKLDAAKATQKEKADALTAATATRKTKEADVKTAEDAVNAADKKLTSKQSAYDKAVKAVEDAKKEHGTHRAAAGDTFASVAAKYGITVKKLKDLNPSVTQTSDGKLHAGTVLKLPVGVGDDVTQKINGLITKREIAKNEVAAAQKALDDAITAQTAARAAAKAARDAEQAAKDAAKAADDAVKAAQKELDAAKGTEGGGETAKVPTKDEVIKAGKGKAYWDKKESDVNVDLFGQHFSFDPVSLRKPVIKDGRATWQYKEITKTFEIDGKKYAVTFKPSFSIKESEFDKASGTVKAGVTPKVGLEILGVKAA